MIIENKSNLKKNEYYLLHRMPGDHDVFIEKYNVEKTLSKSYSEGIPLKLNKPIELFYERKELLKTDFISGIHSFPIVSERFKELLLNEKIKYIEFHPAQLICVESQETDNTYWFLNILHNVNCFDWENSQYKIFPGTKDIIIEVKKLVVKPEQLEKRDLARIAEIKSLIVLSARLQNRIISAEISGIDIQRLEDFKLMY